MSNACLSHVRFRDLEGMDYWSNVAEHVKLKQWHWSNGSGTTAWQYLDRSLIYEVWSQSSRSDAAISPGPFGLDFVYCRAGFESDGLAAVKILTQKYRYRYNTLSFLLCDDFEGNTNISVPIKSGSTVQSNILVGELCSPIAISVLEIIKTIVPQYQLYTVQFLAGNRPYLHSQILQT